MQRGNKVSYHALIIQGYGIKVKTPVAHAGKPLQSGWSLFTLIQRACMIKRYILEKT
jgi:hypothetical protein